MTRLTYYRVKNAMIFSILISNLIGVAIARYFTQRSVFPYLPDIVRLDAQIDKCFLPASLLMSVALILIYERPIRAYLTARYERKAAILSRMLAVARSVPNEWSRHVALGRTPKGYGIHAINIDGDIGPWLQVLKLEGLKALAERKGRPKLSGAEIELMNLAGPATGLEMMLPAARNAPTPNFFERGAYWRNTIVRGKSASELLVALDERMDKNLKNEGAIVFAEVFDEVAAQMRAER